jgi:hypothetical protein
MSLCSPFIGFGDVNESVDGSRNCVDICVTKAGRRGDDDVADGRDDAVQLKSNILKAGRAQILFLGLLVSMSQIYFLC